MNDASPSDDHEDISEPDTPLSPNGDCIDHTFLSRNTSARDSVSTSAKTQDEGVISVHTATPDTEIEDTAPYREQKIEDGRRQDESNSSSESGESAPLGQSILPQLQCAINGLIEEKQESAAAIAPEESRNTCREDDRIPKAKLEIFRRIFSTR